METPEQELERLRAENAKLKGKKKEMSFKVSTKGAVSVYGLQRFPVTLYQEQWIRLLDNGEKIRAFIEANKGQLKGDD